MEFSVHVLKKWLVNNHLVNGSFLILILSQSSERSLKLQHITAAVVEVLQASCGECVSEIMIDNQFFVCYPESPSHVTYRARLEGTSERESGSLISLIEEWVRGGANVIVTGVLMTVDPDCSVAISSLSEGDCSPTTTTITADLPTVAEDLGDSTTIDGGTTIYIAPIITGAVVAVMVVLIIAVTIFAIVFLVLKNRHGELSLKKYFFIFKIISYYYIIILRNVDTVVEKSAITTANNKAYGKVKVEEKNEGYELTDFSSSPPSSSAKLEEMYELPSSSSAVSQPLPSLPPPSSAVAQSEEEEETVYDVIPGDTGHQ